MSIKLLALTPAYKPAFIYGGPTMSVAKLCEELAKANLDLEVYTTTANGRTELSVEVGKGHIVDGVKVTYFNRLTKDHTHFSPALFLALKNAIKRQLKVKRLNLELTTHNSQLIIHIHSWWNMIAILSCQIAKWFNVPVVLSPRGMLTDYTLENRNSIAKSFIHSFMGKKLLQYCHIHATSEQEKEDISAIINPKSITVIPNLVNLPARNSIAEITHKHKICKLLFLSRIEEKKGLSILFEALSQVKCNWELTIAGTGDEQYIESLKKESKDLNIAAGINWVGVVNNQDKFNLMANHDLLVLTSHNENFANVIIESLYMGTAVLLSDRVGLSDYVLMKNFGWVTPMDVNAIACKLEEAMHNIPLRSQIRKNAPKIIEADFNSATLVQQYISLYQQII